MGFSNSRGGTRIKIHKRVWLVLGGALVVSPALTMAGPASAALDSPPPAAASSDTTTVTYNGVPLNFSQTAYMPRLECPAEYPYILNHRYNVGTGFRLDPGIEFTNWSAGFDANVKGNFTFLSQAAPGRERVRIGLKGERWIYSEATYWGLSPAQSNWTLVLHCTSNLNMASFQTA